MGMLHGKSGSRLRRELVSALNSLFGILAIASPLLIITTTWLFNEAGEIGNPALLTVGLAIWSYPPVFILTWFASRRALHRHAMRDLAVPIAAVPAINIVVGLVATVWYWTGCAHTLVC